MNELRRALGVEATVPFEILSCLMHEREREPGSADHGGKKHERNRPRMLATIGSCPG